MGPAFLSSQFGAYPLIKIGDVLDVFTPLVIIPLYWLLFYHADENEPPKVHQSIWFLVIAGLWIEGQGMHLSANSIGHLLKDMLDTDVYQLTDFYDEFLSHYLWHIGTVGFAALLVFCEWVASSGKERTNFGLVGVAGIIHGFNYFTMIVEAKTGLFGVPFAALFVIFGLVKGREKLGAKPLLAFFFITFLIASILFAGWGLYWDGLPEFSAVGIID